MINKGGWRKNKRRKIPPNIRLIESKWVFKKKGYGWVSSHLVVRGHTKIPGVDATVEIEIKRL